MNESLSYPELNSQNNGLASDSLTGIQFGSAQYYLYDGRGSTRATVDRMGSLLSRGAYGAWGATYGGKVPSTALAWNGRWGGYTDAETGLVYLHHRYYAPNLGRFISRDPIGFAGGIALYAYAGDDPVNLADPSGLSTDGQDYVLSHPGDDYSYMWHLWASTKGVLKDIVLPTHWRDNLVASTENFGSVSGEYDAGKASARDVAGAGLRWGVDVGATAFAVYGVSKAGVNGARALISAEGEVVAAEIGEATGGGCFTAGTLVKQAVTDVKSKGGYRVVDTPIEQMKQGNSVVSRDEKTGKTSVKRVLRTTKRTVDVVVVVTLADKSGKVVESITATRNHPFYVSGKGFVPAGGLAVGNAIVTRAGPDAVVAKIEWKRRAEGFAVYNFEVEDDHTYFVGNTGIWVLLRIW